MEFAVLILFAIACSAVMSILAFMVGRCARKLPIDGMLPCVVHSARCSPEKDAPRPAAEPASFDKGSPTLAPGNSAGGI